MLTTTRDVVDEFDNLTSLREAISYANSHPGPDTITFDPSVFGITRRTIVLTGGPLVLTDPATTTIIGPGANRLTISGGGKSQVFVIRGGSVALSGVRITGGRDDIGGGLFNDRGTLALTNVSLAENAAIIGGGLFNNGTARLRNVSVTGNAASVGGGITNFGTLTLAHVTVRANHARFARNLFNGRTATLIRQWWPIKAGMGIPRAF